MPKRPGRKLDDPFATSVIHIPRFGSGQVAGILQMQLWELNRFLSRYELKSSGQLGQGRGSRRVYSPDDICRIETARQLIGDGFTPKLVADIMQNIDDPDFYGTHNLRGEFSEVGVALRRSSSGTKIQLFASSNPPEISLRSETYYVLDLSSIVRRVNTAIKAYLVRDERKGRVN